VADIVRTVPGRHDADPMVTPLPGGITNRGLGYSLDRSIAHAWLPADHSVVGTRVSVEVFGEVVDATVVAEPLFDSAGHRIRA
jgi:4-methylaminobutanoate oxidase (formaldehyde-forming)